MAGLIARGARARARACLVLAAIMWSLGSAFMRILREPLGLGLDSPSISPLQIAFFRGLFGGLAIFILVRRSDVTFRPAMVGMVIAFATMSALYLSALGFGAAGNAIFLQNTAPVWVYLFAVLLLGEVPDRRGIQVVILATLGAIVIVSGGWPRAQSPGDERQEIFVLFMGLGSGVVYAIVVLFLRVLRSHGAAWLVALNLLGTAVVLGLFVLTMDGPSEFMIWLTAPSGRQILVLIVFGILQMALPYWLFTHGLRTIAPQEAAIITLLEPLLNPIWAYLLTPDKDTPTTPMIVGGSLILLALIWRYLPALKSARMAASIDKPAGTGRFE